MRRLAISSLIAVLFLGGFLFVLGPARLGRQLAGADLGVFALGPVAVLAALACWGEASYRLFAGFDPGLSRRRALVAYGAGALGKQVLPMGNAGGPAVMAYAFERETDLGYGRSLAVTVVAEFLSLVASLVLGLLGVAVLLSSSASVPELRWLGVGVVVVGAALAALSFVVWFRRRHVTLGLTGVARLLGPRVGRISPALGERLRPERVDASLRRYYETFDAVVRDRRAVLYAFALSQVGWVLFTLPSRETQSIGTMTIASRATNESRTMTDSAAVVRRSPGPIGVSIDATVEGISPPVSRWRARSPARPTESGPRRRASRGGIRRSGARGRGRR